MSNKVKVVAHMITSIDGDVISDTFMDEHAFPAAEEYGKQGVTLGDSWGCGNGTFLNEIEVDFSKYKGVPVTYEDKTILNDQNHYAFAIDRFGKLRFESKEAPFFGGDFVEVLTKKVSPEFIAYLDDLEIPYLFAGEEDFEPELFLEKIKNLYQIDTFVLAGGPTINGVFMEKDLVDEVNVVIAPNIAGNVKTTTIVGTENMSKFPKHFKVKDVEHNENFVTLRYERV